MLCYDEILLAFHTPLRVILITSYNADSRQSHEQMQYDYLQHTHICFYVCFSLCYFLPLFYHGTSLFDGRKQVFPSSIIWTPCTSLCHILSGFDAVIISEGQVVTLQELFIINRPPRCSLTVEACMIDNAGLVLLMVRFTHPKGDLFQD